MLTSHRRSQNYSDPMGGETLFEFLKRKKKFALEASLSKSRKQNTRSIAESYSPRKKEGVKNYDETLEIQSNIKCLTQRNKNRQCATPQKITTTNPSKKNKQVSFIEMISPARKNGERSLTPENHRDHENRLRIKQQSKQQNIQSKKKTQEIFYRKNLNRSLAAYKETLLKFTNDGKMIKEKAHTLFIELKPILKYVEEGPNKNFGRRAEQVKLKLRSFEHIFREFNVENNSQMIENLHRSVSEHILSLQGKIRAELDKSDIGTLNKMREEKDGKIDKLSEQLEILEKDLQLTKRRLEKSQRMNERLKQEQQNTSCRQTHRLQQKSSLYEEKLTQFEKQINSLANQLDLSKQREKELEKKVKDATFLKQEAEKRFIQESTRIKSTKEDYLLNQIEILKKQFKNDMKQLTALYKEKQEQNLLIIDQLQKEKADLVITLQGFRGAEKKAVDELSQNRGQIEKFKKQNQCLVTDLNRMNEELYQHWLALKDIKTLAFRLQIFPKFQRIYLDLPYNDQLFI